MALARVILVCLALAGCTTPSTSATPELEDQVGGSERDAVALFEHWLAAAAGGAPDRGYSLLYPSFRQDIFGDPDTYVAALRSVGLEDLPWTVEGVTLRDGEYHIAVRVPGGRNEVPSQLLEWRVVSFPQGGDGPSDIGDVVVRIAPGGWPAGIQGG